MRTHARYDLQQGDSVSIDETRTDSPLSVGSGLITSRSVSSESTEPQPPPPEKPPSPMDVEEERQNDP